MRCDPSSERPPLPALVLAVMLSACNRGSTIAPPQTALPAAAAAAVPHGDHNPHHGGVVMMKGDDLHYEVVLDPGGHSYRLYFTDAVRDELPAAVAADVALTIHRPGVAGERVALRIDDDGESWVGNGQPVSDPAKTTVRVAFTISSAPYWIDLPFTK